MVSFNTTKINFSNKIISYDLLTNNLRLINLNYFAKKINNNNNFNIFNNKIKLSTFFEFDKLDETFISEDNFRVHNVKFPIKLQLGILNKNTVDIFSNNSLYNLKNIFLNYKINKDNTTTKLSHFEEFWGFRQKRYKKLRNYSFSQNTKYSSMSYSFIENFINSKNLNKYNLYNSFKNNKFKHELIPVTLAKRLLRTKRTLVLPVHINITLITNSYDVVHS